MSEYAARAALERMNLREVAIAPHYGALAADLRQMSLAVPEEANAAFLARRAELCSAYGLSPMEQRKPFAFSSGLAIIPVSGSLINRFGACWGYVTGYNFIRSQLNAALADDDVTGIVFDLNSYGGEAAGCFEIADEIYAARSQKPILGVIDSNCYSACYAIGSACSQLVITPSGGAGSIGVVAMHVDVSKMYEKFGVTVTFMFDGDHKVDGNPYEPLTAEVKADILKGVKKSGAAFHALVARNKEIDEAVVKGTQARIYRADEALSIGLVDAIATPSEAVLAFFDELSGSKREGEDSMSAETNKPGEAAPAATPDQLKSAAAEARTAERARVSGILGCEEAKGRESLASHLAMHTDMSVDAAKAVLASAPAAVAAAAPAAAAPAATAPAADATNPFKAAMDADKHPKVGADGAGGEDDKGEAPHMAILRAQQQATGLKLVE